VADFGIWGIIDYISKNTYYIHIQKFYCSRLRVAGNTKILIYDKQKNEV